MGTNTAAVALRKILDAYLEHHDSQEDAALPLGITGSRLGRIRKGEYAPDVLTCLRLALAASVPPADVLRAAGKSEVADLLDVLYGRTSAAVPNHHARAFLRQREALPPAVRRAFDALLRELAR